MRLLFILFFILFSIHFQAQSFEKQLITICYSDNFKQLDHQLKSLKSKNDSTFKYETKTLINYEIIDNFNAYLYEIKQEKYTNGQFKIWTISTYRIKIIEKNNQIASYEIEKGNKNKSDFWNVESYIIKNCGTSLYKEFSEKHDSIYGIRPITELIFHTNEIYFAVEKNQSTLFACPLYKKRELFSHIIEKKDTTTLLNWLKSGNVPIQLYAIEGIFILTEKGIDFPPNTWNLIQIVQQKKGQVPLAKNCYMENFSINVIVQQIKGKHRKAKWKLKQNRVK